jgi:methylated-DNA-[protein]-cysteine S-methyltransferase
MDRERERHHDLINTPWGWIGAVYSDAGLQGLLLPRKTRKEAESLLEKTFGPTGKGRPWKELRGQLRDWFDGKRGKLSLPLDITPPGDFTGRVWAATTAIPPGATATYGEIAERAGSKGAARAAGQALRRNPVPIFIPCHRVMGAAGPGGFAGSPRPGLKMKMLSLEKEGKRGGRSR